MKKFLLSAIAVLAVVSFVMTGCGDKKEEKKSSSKTSVTAASTTQEETTEKETETPTEKATESKSQKTDNSSQETAEETIEEKATQAPSTDYQKILTSKKWNAQKCFENGVEQNIQSYYGSIVRDTGAYLQFKKDGTFKCVMGFIGCDGTYNVDENGNVTVTKTVLYKGDNESKINQTEKLKTEGEIDSITMNLDGVDILFI